MCTGGGAHNPQILSRSSGGRRGKTENEVIGFVGSTLGGAEALWLRRCFEVESMKSSGGGLPILRVGGTEPMLRYGYILCRPRSIKRKEIRSEILEHRKYIVDGRR